MSKAQVRLAESDADLARCYPVMAELRPHITRDEFIPRVRRQNKQAGYRMAFVEEDEAVRAVAGFRVGEYMAWGNAMYVDDLVTSETVRSRGHGALLLNWLIDLARAEHCDSFQLDSGVQRFRAHRFYLQQNMIISSHHFSIVFSPEKTVYSGVRKS